MANAIPTDLKDRNGIAVMTGQLVAMCYNDEEKFLTIAKEAIDNLI